MNTGEEFWVEARHFEKIGHIKPFNREELLEQIAKGNLSIIYDYDLTGADLSYINLRGANLESANLESANLESANLRGVVYNEFTAFFALQCPEEGSFIGYKKAENHIVKIRIAEAAYRTSATTRKCRCSEAQVISITTLEGEDDGVKTVHSNYDMNFLYTVGETVKVNDFEMDRWIECAAGIHFFITRQEAVNY